MLLVNIGKAGTSFPIYGSGSRVRLKPGESYDVGGCSSKEISYYNSMTGIRVIDNTAVPLQKKEADIKSFLLANLPTDKEEVEVVNASADSFEDFLIETLLEDELPLPVVERVINDPKYSADSIYTDEFLTKKRSMYILKERNIDFDSNESAKVLKELVLKSNPS